MLYPPPTSTPPTAPITAPVTGPLSTASVTPSNLPLLPNLDSLPPTVSIAEPHFSCDNCTKTHVLYCCPSTCKAIVPDTGAVCGRHMPCGYHYVVISVDNYRHIL